ncbi:unnamed protein product [Peniophora sp. CBMAI 1063]|nr:unnamed protein product [Peniophora sp. CBMAI 1063]
MNAPSSVDRPAPVTVNRMVAERYRLIAEVGSGFHSRIYRAHDTVEDVDVAIKVEFHEYGDGSLANEHMIYQFLRGCAGTPQLLWYGVHSDVCTAMVIPLLGPSLHALNEAQGGLRLMTILGFALDCITILEGIHDRGVIHGDVSPKNILLARPLRNGSPTNGEIGGSNKLVIVDFGSSRKLEAIRPLPTYAPIGTFIFGSHNDGYYTPSPYDDLESLSYVVMFLLAGSLPWDDEIDLDRLRDMKLNLSPQAFKHTLPPCVFDIHEYAIKGTRERPNYQLMKEKVLHGMWIETLTSVAKFVRNSPSNGRSGLSSTSPLKKISPL